MVLEKGTGVWERRIMEEVEKREGEAFKVASEGTAKVGVQGANGGSIQHIPSADGRAALDKSV